ncbi:hypothetical protein [Pantoea coffeiphila]|uniref:Uncharacterized protein n=1 Tax=Pantoea coffeiphila TaxID=1465635 RepID=A0A2S9IBQ5_9GAMM|nr:hypothetical protein [Pantoea coffeiphila]PRD15220.1 hypothetical protein CQW29_12200 [Pantoea coffeiphila]
MFNKIGVLASICTVLGFLVTIYTMTPYSNSAEVSQNIEGNGNVVLGGDNSTINVNNGRGDIQSKVLVLNRSTPILSVPEIFAATEKNKIVCYGIEGDEIKLTGRSKDNIGTIMKEVQVLSSECINKIGWVVISSLSYR